MAIIYCVPGIGADSGMFSRLVLPGHEIRHVKWLLPHKRERLGDYALRLAAAFDTSKPFVLIGVSFGGMICAELARRLNPSAVFLVGSSKSRKELPFRFRFLKYFPVHRYLSDRAFIWSAVISRRVFGYRGRADKEHFHRMLASAPHGYYSRAADCIINWDAEVSASGIIHIHGTRDLVLPVSGVKADYVIQGGTHNLLRDHAPQVCEIILSELKKKGL